VTLHWEVLVVNPVLARSMEMELGERIARAVDNKSSIRHDHLHSRAQIFKLSGLDGRDLHLDGAGSGVRDSVGLDIDGRLELSLGAC
jgi:hypothetical protein